MGEFPTDPSIAQEQVGPPKDENEARLRQATIAHESNLRRIKNLEDWTSQNPTDSSSRMDLAKLRSEQAHWKKVIDNQGHEEEGGLETQTQTQRQRY